MTWSEITDNEIAAYRPITARLKRKYRDNDRAARRFALQGFSSGGMGQVGPTDYTSAGTLHIYVPLYLKGDNGTTITIVPDLEAVTGGTGNTSVYCKLVHGSDESTVAGPITQNGTGSNRQEYGVMTLTFTPTGNVVEDIEVHLKVDTTATIAGTGYFYMPNTRANSHIQEAD